MLKKLLMLTLAMMAFSASGYAEKLTTSPVDLELYGDLDAILKIQTDYRTPLDSADYLEELGGDWENGIDYRDGANNRSSQKIRAIGTLTMVGRSGENDYEGTTWYNLIGVIKLDMDANDPDYPGREYKDGSYEDKVSLADVWIRYAPIAALGIKIGTQTIVQTANAYGIGHLFVGDPEDDFVFYTASVLDEKPGVSIDFHLSKNIEFGIGMLQGLGDLSAITSQGGSTEANNAVAWFQGKFGMIDVLVGHQSISVGDDSGFDDDPDKIINKWQHESKHTVSNLLVKATFENWAPFIGYQAVSGDMTSARSFETYNTTLVDSTNTALAIIGASGRLEALNNNLKTQDIEIIAITLGILGKLGPGDLALERTVLNTPVWGKDKNVAPAVEVDSISQIDYEIPISKNAKLTLFYKNLTAKEDKKLREDIETAQNNYETIVANQAALSTTLGSDTYALLEANAANAAGLGLYTWSSSTSVGISFNMKFGN